MVFLHQGSPGSIGFLAIRKICSALLLDRGFQGCVEGCLCALEGGQVEDGEGLHELAPPLLVHVPGQFDVDDTCQRE